MSKKHITKERPFDPVIFWVSASLTIVFILWSILFPEGMNKSINGIFSWTTQTWGWLYLLTAFFLVVGCFFLMGGKYGSMKLGKPGDKPEYSNFSWFAMLFSAGVGIGLLFFGIAEPMFYFDNTQPWGYPNNPFADMAGVAAMDAQRAVYAMRVT